MQPDLKDETIIRRYLLGELTQEEERERFEERLMADDDFFEEFQLVKEELIDQYLEGEITRAERERFERHFLTTTDRRRSLRLAQALSTYHAPAPGVIVGKKTEAARAPFTWARGFFASPLRPAVTLLAIAVVAAGVWFAFFRRPQPQAVNEGLTALNDAYRYERPMEGRVSDFRHVPLANKRSGEEVKFDPTSRDRAEVMLHFAEKNDPGAAASHALGKLYLFEGKFDDAIRYLNEALKADGNDPKIHNDLGAAWLEKGEADVQRGDEAAGAESYAKSLGHLDRALQLDPTLLEALFNRGLVHTHLKLFRLAADDWRAYLEKDATSSWAGEARQRLKSLNEQTRAGAQDKEQDFQNFRSAVEAGDGEAAWTLLSQSRDFAGSFIENRLLDEYLEAAAGGRDGEARERLRAMSYAGELEIQRGGDHFMSDLTNCYAGATRERLAALAGARGQMKVGHGHLGQDRTGQALEAYGEAARVFEQNGDACEALLVRYLSAQARLLQGESVQSLTEFEAVRQASEVGRYGWLFGQTLSALANVHIGLNNFSMALEHSRQSLEILERVGDTVGVAKVNDQLGVEYLRVGRPREALSFHCRAVTLVSENSLGPLPLWRSYYTAAMPFQALGLTDASIDFTLEALRLAQDTKSPVNVSHSYANLGLMYGGRGDYESAVEYLRRALDSGKDVQTEKTRTSALAYATLQLGNVYRLAGNFASALESYDEAIRLYDQLNFGAFSYVAHKGKFLSCVALREKCPSAEQELETALRLYEEYRPKIIETRNRYSFFDNEQGVYDVAIDYAYTSKGDKRKAFDYSEKCRARSILDLGRADELGPEQSLNRAPIRAAPAAPAELNEIQSQLPDEAQVVQYAVLEDKLLIWFVSKARFEGFQQPVSSKALEEKVQSYVRLVLSRSEEDEGERRRASAELYDLLIRPVAPLLERGKLVCIVPDKILNRLPYVTLAPSPDGKYLIEDYALTFSPSSSMFVLRSREALERFSQGPERLLSVGNPRFDHDAFPSYKYLPAAAVEAEKVATLYDSSEVLTDADATKARVVRAMERADVIHLATHSTVDEHSPTYSKLLLAKGAGGDGDGVLLTHEIYGLGLARTRLVVLSACSTAAEQYYGGEGMVGIWSPFVTRNVPLVVASLWAVDSDSTKDLMVNFHRLRRRGGLPTAEALRQAQVEMLQGPDKSYRQPYHWAPFIAIGGYTRF